MRDEFETSDVRIPPQVNFLPIGHAAHRVMNALFRFADKAWRVTAGRVMIMRFIPDQDPRNFSRGMRELVMKGYVKRQRNRDRKTGADEKNEYLIALPSLKKIRQKYEVERSAPRCVISTHPRASKTTQKTAPYKSELKEENLKHGYGEPRAKRGEKADHKKEIEAGIAYFKRLYKKKLGKDFEPTGLDRHAMWCLVRPGKYGMAAALAACDLWFSSYAPWAERAKACGYALVGSAKPHGGMEWHMEWITSLPSYDDRKREHSAALHR